MSDSARFVTIDLGAESGRAVLGEISHDRLILREVHRFPNEPQRILDRFFWDTVRLFGEIKHGLAKCAKTIDGPLHGIGVDTWGVDFALLDSHDDLISLPYHYRDHRTDKTMATAFDVVNRDEIYAQTGIQFMQINTLFQLLAIKSYAPHQLETADRLLMTPDLIHFWLSGVKSNEATIASTSQCYNPVTGTWATDLLEKFGLPSHLFGEVIPPGTVLGSLHSSIRADTGLGEVPVIAPASHDTASAVAGAPVQHGSDWAYISCGTWSLVGMELDSPVINAQSQSFNLTNEGGVGGTTRLLRNVMGLWLLQQSKRSWEKHGSFFSYDQLSNMAARELPFRAFIDPDDPAFLNPTDMVAAIGDYCRRTGQRVPDGVGPVVECIIESLALKYRWVIDRLEAVTGKTISTIHMIGGGTQNRHLCQATADATNRRVLAGPIEATAAGNIIVQAMAAGIVPSLDEGRNMISRSFPVEEYTPKKPDKWDAAFRKFEVIIGQV